MLSGMAATPNFVRFCRSLALLTGPFIPIGAIAIPAFVEGAFLCSCSSSSAGGSCISADDLDAGCGYCGCSRVDSSSSSDSNVSDTKANDSASDTSPADAADGDSPEGVSTDSTPAETDSD